MFYKEKLSWLWYWYATEDSSNSVEVVKLAVLLLDLAVVVHLLLPDGHERLELVDDVAARLHGIGSPCTSSSHLSFNRSNLNLKRLKWNILKHNTIYTRGKLFVGILTVPICTELFHKAWFASNKFIINTPTDIDMNTWLSLKPSSHNLTWISTCRKTNPKTRMVQI